MAVIRWGAGFAHLHATVRDSPCHRAHRPNPTAGASPDAIDFEAGTRPLQPAAGRLLRRPAHRSAPTDEVVGTMPGPIPRSPRRSP